MPEPTTRSVVDQLQKAAAAQQRVAEAARAAAAEIKAPAPPAAPAETPKGGR
jgi:hypothetical protein